MAPIENEQYVLHQPDSPIFLQQKRIEHPKTQTIPIGSMYGIFSLPLAEMYGKM